MARAARERHGGCLDTGRAPNGLRRRAPGVARSTWGWKVGFAESTPATASVRHAGGAGRRRSARARAMVPLARVGRDGGGGLPGGEPDGRRPWTPRELSRGGSSRINRGRAGPVAFVRGHWRSPGFDVRKKRPARLDAAPFPGAVTSRCHSRARGGATGRTWGAAGWSFLNCGQRLSLDDFAAQVLGALAAPPMLRPGSAGTMLAVEPARARRGWPEAQASQGAVRSAGLGRPQRVGPALAFDSLGGQAGGPVPQRAAGARGDAQGGGVIELVGPAGCVPTSIVGTRSCILKRWPGWRPRIHRSRARTVVADGLGRTPSVAGISRGMGWATPGPSPGGAGAALEAAKGGVERTGSPPASARRVEGDGMNPPSRRRRARSAQKPPGSLNPRPVRPRRWRSAAPSPRADGLVTLVRTDPGSTAASSDKTSASTRAGAPRVLRSAIGLTDAQHLGDRGPPVGPRPRDHRPA